MDWFESWFDSPYYHILYANRDENEAKEFIHKVYTTLEIQSSDILLDLACGAGRHARSLAEYGNHVVGIDLSSNSINSANEQLKIQPITNLEFRVADMRNFELGLTFDFVFNLFTSFGYFTDKRENKKVVQQIAQHQKSGGITIIDYLNSHKVKSTGDSKEIKTISNIEFRLEKYVEQDMVYKNIEFQDQSASFKFREQVQLFELGEIESYFIDLGYEVWKHWGNYLLEPYHIESDRSILVFKK